MARKVPLGAKIAELTRAGRAAEAVRQVEGALKSAPGDVALLTALAQLHNRSTRNYAAAVRAAEQAVAKAPRSVPALMEAAQARCNLHDFPAAQAHVDRARTLAPRNPDVLYVLATIQHRTDRFEEEVATLDTALRLRPGHRPARLQRANALVSAGRLAEAAEACRDLFAENPDSLHLYGVYAAAATVAPDDPLVAHLRDVVLPAQTLPKNRARALKLLAKFEDDLGGYDRAMELTRQANEAEDVHHDGRRHAAFVTAQTTLTRADYFGGGGAADDTPVLIVGMPRSGSTLLEQVLSRHAQIGGIGESDALRATLRDRGVQDHDGPGLLRLIRGLSGAEATALGNAYLSRIRSQAGERPRIIDKKLHNFELLGLVACLLPRASILHATRDPMDTCVSCYLQRLSPWHAYTRDLGTLGRYYRQYRRLMEHWRVVLPNPILDVAYEDMVVDPEGTARRAVDFLGLDWDPACLDHVGGKEVRTLSAAQVRRPIYTSSVRKWRRYDAHLAPLKAELQALYDETL